MTRSVPPDQKPKDRPLVVLVADDHAIYRQGFTQFLIDHFDDARVIEVGSFDQALEELEKSQVRLGIFDLCMPGISSPADLAVVRDCYPEMKLVVLSGSEAREDMLASLAAGAHGYIAKSHENDQIASALTKVIRGEIYAPPLLAERKHASKDKPLETPEAAASSPKNEPKANLTRRQTQVLNLLGEGKSNKEIARDLGLSESTVKIHVAALLRALGAKNRTHALTLAGKASA